MSESREDSVYLAKLAEQAERYEGARASRVPHFIRLMDRLRNGREYEACCLV
jgi:hypothetical protein